MDDVEPAITPAPVDAAVPSLMPVLVEPTPAAIIDVEPVPVSLDSIDA